jgi:LacI family transcriptional regulator
MRPVTQEDIARELGVTRITVSKALRDHPDISVAMKARVLKAAEEMGYSPNEIARQLTSRTTQTLGVVVPDLENSFFSHVVDSIIDTATDRDYQVLLAVSREKEDIERKNILNLAGKRVDGLLVCLTQQTRDRQVFHQVKKMGIPLVFYDRSLPETEFSRVVFDDAAGMNLAVDQIAGAGYSRIAHFAGYSSTAVGQERLEGFRSALLRNQLPLREEWISEGGFEVADGYAAFQKIRSLGPLPQVIIAVNDRVALGAYRAIREAGLRIPEDIGIVGFGFSETAELFSPTLSVITQDPRNMGIMAALLLIDEVRSEGPVAHQHIRLKETFIWNQSVKSNSLS